VKRWPFKAPHRPQHRKENAMSKQRGQRRRGFVAVEVASVIAVIALLMAMGFMLYRSIRLAARVALAESHLKQVSTAMELHFRRFNSYPPPGSDLTVELAPFVQNPNVFNNPLMEEQTPGQTINNLYCAPSVNELDRPNRFLTGMVADNGRTAVILWTGHRIERRDDIPFNPANPGAYLLAALNPDMPPIDGSLNLNPENSDDFEFLLVKPDGSTIDRDDLLASDGNLSYTGPAVTIRLRPKGHGNQNTIRVGGVPRRLQNGTLYTITSDAMEVYLYNRKSEKKGRAMGQFWIDIDAESASIATGEW